MSWLSKLTNLSLLVMLVSCTGDHNLWDCWSGFKRIKCDKPTAEQIAQNHLNNGDFSAAIEVLTPAIADEPENYARYPLLAAAYAGRGGIDILGIARKQIGSSDSALTSFSAFLPTPNTVDAETYQQDLADVASAVATLRAVPSNILTDSEAFPYSASAILELTIYQSSYSIMFLNQFIISPTTGTITVDQLANMTPEQAEQVITNLLAVGDLPQVSGNSNMQSAVSAIATTINDQPGATTKDKIAAYVATQNK